MMPDGGLDIGNLPWLSSQPRHRRRGSGSSFAALACMSSLACGATIELEVDATDLSRNLLRSVMRIETTPALRERGGEFDLRFVVWSPGNHTPSGPVENVVDLVVRDCRGGVLEWDRDPERMERIVVKSPAACDAIEVSMSYIASQPNVNSRSTDSYGRPNLGVLNWNTVLFYPAAMTNQDATVRATLLLPSEWSYATSLRAAETDGERFATLRQLDPGRAVNVVTFVEAPLAEVVDSPVIMGRYLRAHPLEFEGVPGAPPHVVCIVSSEEKHAEAPEWLLKKIASSCEQTMRLCGTDGRWFPRDRYEFLLVADSSMGFAVEHGESTLCAVGSKVFVDAKEPENDSVKGGGASLTVLIHEYFHAWCGKLACPEGLVRPDFSTPARTELLWVYEGLTTYYDNVLAARGGMITIEEYKQDVLNLAVALEQRSGRLWRSVEDTAVAARYLRNRGLYWYDKRRGQEYYGEGALFWMEADAIIRRSSQGEKSLDDFCKELFAVEVRPVGSQATHTREDVVRILTDLDGSTDWDGLIRARIEEPAPSLDVSPVLALLGWRVEFADEPTKEQKKLIDEGDVVNLRTSLGLRLSKDGEITDIVPGGPADVAGLAYGMKVLAVGGWEWSKDRMKDAVKDSTRTKGVEMVVSFGGRVETKRVAYEGGMRVPRLVRIEGESDLIGEAVRAR
ncbi:MAG: M61 family metallopeptidase [Phycisphaerae bacterium]|nr:M61 family metallopeptidase [Phycisphaerae bacterium]